MRSIQRNNPVATSPQTSYDRFHHSSIVVFLNNNMSTLETEVAFRKQQELSQDLEAKLHSASSSSEFILITDHRTSKSRSLELLEAAEANAAPTNCCRNICRKKTLKRRLPILRWLPKYRPRDAIGDAIAGVTVALTVISQGLAYSSVAGLPPQFGLYGSFAGCFVYALLGTCKDSTIGSTAVASLMIYQFAKGSWQRSVLLTFLTGIIEVLMAAFKLGCLVEFVSGPVSAGFTSAVALIVSTSQMKEILGVKSEGASFLQRWISMFRDIQNVRVADACLGFGCVCLLLIMRSLGRITLGSKEHPQKLSLTQRLLNRLFWCLGITRNASVVVGAAMVAMYLETKNSNPFRLTGYIPPGVASISLPPFYVEAQPGNATAGIPDVPAESFFDMLQSIGYGLIIVPIIALLENISVCKAFSKGKPIDTSQEIFAIGVANIANSLVSGYRGNGGLARTAINNASGARTQLSNLYIGIVVIFALSYLTEYFAYIPRAVLGSIILSAVIFQVQYQIVLPMWRSKRSDLVPGVFAFFACLVLPLEVGIIVAIGANQLFILYHSARPKITLETLETEQGIKFVKITPDRCLIFPSVEFVRNLVLKSGSKSTLPVVIDCTYIYAADFTAAKVISSMVEDFRRRKQKIIFFNLKPSVVSIFEGLHTRLVLCYNTHTLSMALQENGNADTDLSHSVDSLDRAETATGISSVECVSMASTLSLSKS